MKIRKFNREIDSEDCVVILPAERKWYQIILDTILDRSPLERCVVVNRRNEAIDAK